MPDPLTPGDPLRTPGDPHEAPTERQETPSSGAPPPPGPRKLTRSSEDRVVAGVSGGLGRYFGVDPILFRIGFAVLVLAGGAGILAYLAAWLFVPSDAPGAPQERSALQIAGAVLLVVIAFAILAPLSFALVPAIVPLAVVAAVGVLLWRAARGSDVSPGKVLGQIALVMLALAGAILTAIAVGVAAAVGGGWVVATVVVVAGVLLMSAAFVGGARWLIVPALVLVIPLAIVSAADLDVDGGIGDREYHPLSAAELRDGYDLGMGDLTLDLRDMELPQGLTEVDLQIGLGAATVYVPRDVCVNTRADVGAGYVDVLGRDNGGIDLEVEDVPAPADATTPRLLIDAEIGAGALEVRHDVIDRVGVRFGDRFDDTPALAQDACRA